DTRKTVPSLSAFMGLDRLPVTVRPSPTGTRYDYPGAAWLLATRKDSAGVRWGLVASGILGSRGDLWIVRHDGRHWTPPLFTGVTYAKGFFYPHDPPRFYGLTEHEMLGGGWFQKFVGNRDLARDGDGDGWTDLVEQRLGTDPLKADSDGDGIPDS